jgi:hypothetical protein
MQDVRGLRLRESGLETLRALAGPAARPLGHARGDDYAFLAVSAGAYPVTRSFVFLPGFRALVTFDAAAADVSLKWVLEGADQRETVSTESAALHVIQMAKPQPVGKVESDDLAGVRLGEWVVLFHTEMQMAQSAVSFDVAGPTALRFLLTGLAPGAWEIWRAGMLENDEVLVAPDAGALYLTGKPGSYFLRHR